MTDNLLIMSKIDVIRLEMETIIRSFESEDQDLNDFLLNDAKNYLKSFLAITYLLKYGDEIIAYFSLSNDNLSKNDEEKALWNKVNRAIPNDKRRRTYPAVKSGRLAVSRRYTGLGLGNTIILTVREMYVRQQQNAGCRFITVDAYRNALSFYEKNQFKFLTEKDKDEDTRSMYFDLKSI